MGFYINAGNEDLKEALASEIFVDKSLVLAKLCRLMGTKQKFLCVSRPRRFGKTTVRDLMVAYFSKGCDSREMFSNLKIAKEPCFEENLNKFNVIAVDLGAVYNSIKDRNETIKTLEVWFREDFQKEYTDIAFSENDSLSRMIQKVYDHTKTQFIIIIDEYDTLIRERQSESLLEEYRSFLNSLFKNNELSSAIALAYLTGILPIMRDKVQSKLNNFDEYTILSPSMTAEFFGFTKEETEALCNEYGMSFAECENWYDGYKIGELDIYNPNSVVRAMMRREYDNYWQKTGSYEVVSDYIKLDFDGTKSAILDMLAGNEIKVNVRNFKNVLSDIKTKDDVLTYLIHLGYVNYNKKTGLCRIPNKEIRQEWEAAIEDSENFSKVVKMISDSEKLLKLTQEGDSERVAAALDNAHQTVADPLDYNDESSLKTAIILAYYTATSKYTIVKELPTGRGFADIGFIPLDRKDPAMIVELKYDKDAESAIKQIKNKNYPKVFENYLENLLLVGVNYDKSTKVHECLVEKYQG